jgi:serine/threonine protein kinase
MTSDPTGKLFLGTLDGSTEPGSDDARVEKLAQRWHELQESGQSASVESVCSDFPQLIPAVRAYLEKFGKMEAFLATQAPSTDTLRGSWSPDNILAAPQGPDELGRLGGYRVLRLIGQGGMGKVYLAEDVQLKRRVALKVLLKGGDQRFLREAQTMALVEHDHIVLIYQVGEDRGTQFLAMPYLQGETLDCRLKKTPRLPLAESIRIAKQITQGLKAAHDRGIIHRDIKPSNIWLEEGTDRVKILDFGLARSEDAETMLTQEGAVVGTPAFMAPEQAQGNPVDLRVDLFSLGCVLYQMISGVSPFARKDVLSTLRALELETPETPTVRYPDTPGPLADLAMKLLEKKPENRPSSAKEVLDALEAIEKKMASGTLPTLNLPPHDVTMRESLPAKSTAAKTQNGFAGIAIAAVAACLMVAAAYFFWPDKQANSNLSNVDSNVKQGSGGDKGVAAAKVDKTLVQAAKDTLPEITRKDFKINVQVANVKTDEKGVLRAKDGDSFRFKVNVEQDAYVGIWFLADDGSTTQYFPNEFDTNNFFQKGKEYTIPSNDRYTIDATPSKELEMFRVIATTRPWKWDNANVAQTFRQFRDKGQFEEHLRGVVLKANPNIQDRIANAAMPVWVDK